MPVAHLSSHEEPKPPLSTSQLLRAVVGTKHDFEWYPTTNEIINAIKKDISLPDRYDCKNPSVLDCGAGDGRVLRALTNGDKYAIEKSRPLIAALDKDIYIVGTEFKEQTLIDKRVDIVFSNPPYSEFVEWSVKIIREANASCVYLVIPSRWKENERIQGAIAAREAEVETVGAFDFTAADRSARAHVEILRISLCRVGKYGRRADAVNVDPFELWFHENFKLNAAQSERSKYAAEEMDKASLKEKINSQLVAGNNLIAVLDELYQSELADLIQTYQALCRIDSAILQELDVNIDGVKKALKQRIAGLKDRYWKELFNNLDRVTDRLTTKSRQAMLTTLSEHTHVDFTQSNAHALLVWVIKNANAYFDSQLISLVEMLTEKANVVFYKSNQITVGRDQWRYNRTGEGLTRFKIDYRIVLSWVGGLVGKSYWRDVNGLSESAADLLSDLRAVASNLGFVISGHAGPRDYQWDDSSNRRFTFTDHASGRIVTLFDVRAFKNGNLHIKLNQDLACRLNCEFGRLKGWIKSPQEAANEMDIDIRAAESSFNVNLKLDGPGLLMLG